MGQLQPRLTVICTATSVNVPQRVVWWIGTNGDPPSSDNFNTRPGVLNMRHPDGTTLQGDIRAACRSNLRGRDDIDRSQVIFSRDKRVPQSKLLSVADIMDDIINHTTCHNLTDQWGRNVFEPDAQFSCYTKTPWQNDDPMRAISWRNKMPVPGPAFGDSRRADAENAFKYDGPYFPDYYYYGQYQQYGGFTYRYNWGSHPGEDVYGDFFEPSTRPWLDSSAQVNGLACHPGQPRTWHPVVMDNVLDPAVYEVWLSEVNLALRPSAGPGYDINEDEETPCAISNFNHGFFPVSAADGDAQCTAGPEPALLDINTRFDSFVLCDPRNAFRGIGDDVPVPEIEDYLNVELGGYGTAVGDLRRRSKAQGTVPETLAFRMDSGAICDAQCVAGYVAVGTLKCLNGDWTYADFKCVPQGTACELPGDVDPLQYNPYLFLPGLRNSHAIDEHIVGVSGAGCGHVSENGASCSFHCDFGLDHQRVLAHKGPRSFDEISVERRAKKLSDGVGQITCVNGLWRPGPGYAGCQRPACEEQLYGGILNWTRGGVHLSEGIQMHYPLWRDQPWYSHPSGAPTFLTVPQGSIQGNGHFKNAAMWTFGNCSSLGTMNKFCMTCASKHCSVYAVVWHQPGMSEGLNGAIPALEQQGWTPGGRCAPKFWANITDTPLCFWPTVALRYDMACGESVCIDQALLGSSTDLRHFAIIGTRRKNCADNSLNDAVSCEQQEPYYANTCEWVDNQCVERAAWCPTPQASEGTSTSGGGTSGGGTSGGGEDRFMCTTPPWSGSECSPISAPL